jgi:hypothetical protein
MKDKQSPDMGIFNEPSHEIDELRQVDVSQSLGSHSIPEVIKISDSEIATASETVFVTDFEKGYEYLVREHPDQAETYIQAATYLNRNGRFSTLALEALIEVRSESLKDLHKSKTKAN